MKRYTEEKERLEKKKEEIRGHLAQLRKEKRELRETLSKCTGEGPGWAHGGWGFPRGEPGPVPPAFSPASLGTGACPLLPAVKSHCPMQRDPLTHCQ